MADSTTRSMIDRARQLQAEINALGAGPAAATQLTKDDRFIIDEARRIAPELHASGLSARERLAGELLRQLADLAERLAGGSAECPDHRPVHDSYLGWFCAACGSDAPPTA